MSDLSAEHWPLAPSDRIKVEISCTLEEAELAADELFSLGASAVEETRVYYDVGSTRVGRLEEGGMRLVADLPASMRRLVRQRWLFAKISDVVDPPPQRAEPYVVGGRLVVRPSDVPVDVAAAGLDPGWSVLVVDPGQAFGSGTHATTRGCLAEVLRLSDEGRLDGADVLDVGCGTGVLGLAALVVGARGLVAVDTDPAAVAATRTNAEANDLLGHTRTAASLELVDGTFELVLANLLAPVFDDLGPRIAAAVAPGGLLVASGVLEEQVDRVLDAAPDLVLEQRADVDGWAVLTLVRPL